MANETFRSTVIHGNSGHSWNTTPRSGLMPPTGRPWTRQRPASAALSPAMMLPADNRVRCGSIVWLQVVRPGRALLQHGQQAGQAFLQRAAARVEEQVCLRVERSPAGEDGLEILH